MEAVFTCVRRRLRINNRIVRVVLSARKLQYTYTYIYIHKLPYVHYGVFAKVGEKANESKWWQALKLSVNGTKRRRRQAQRSLKNY